MKKTAIALTLIAAFLVFSGCSKDNPTNATNDTTAQDFVPLPLAVGNTWIYETNTGYDTIKVTGLMQVNNQALYVLDDDWLWDNDACYYSNGILYGRKLNDSTSTEIVFPKNPIIGQTWITSQAAQATWVLQSNSDQISVPAGTYTCYRIIVRWPESTWYYWWTNGKGIIKMADSANTANAFKLVSITLN